MAEFDVVVVGGGIQGLMLAWEIARRGGRPLLLERHVLGEGASGASLGIVHGGLRYLQSLDLPRWYRSRREQLWFAGEFSGHVSPLRCVMPLYRGAFRSPGLFQSAFFVERVIAQVTGLRSVGQKARLLPPAEAAAGYPVPEEGLTGAAVWPELAIDDPPGLMRDIAGRVEHAGGSVREQEEVVGLDIVNGVVKGVVVRGPKGEWRHPTNAVMLCVGAASRTVAGWFDRDLPTLSARTLAFNLLLNARAVHGEALAISPVAGRGRSLFLREQGGRLLAGTFYAPFAEVEPGASLVVPPALVSAFLDELFRAAPWLKGTTVRETWAGLLPDVDGQGRRLRARDLILDHSKHGGPRGLWTLLGTKLTTAHALAVEGANRVLPKVLRKRPYNE